MTKEAKTKEKKLKRISTGITFLDKKIQGGFKHNSINIVTGPTGSGKSIFATQFLTQNIKPDEKCLYITFEERKSQFYPNMKKLGLDLEKLEKEKKFFFLEYTPEKVKTMLEEGGGIVESIVLKEKINKIVIDSITSFLLLFEKEIEKRKAILSLFNMLRRWECTTLLTYEETQSHENLTENILEFESDSIIILYLTREKKERTRQLEILKMRGTNHPSKIFKLDIGKTGMKVR